ncbi:hypothetical protein PRIC2_012141 [Phytophthora ramorum]
MAPRLDEACAEVPWPAMNMFESDHILADFLNEMDELDRLQDPPLKRTDLKRTRELETHTEQNPKRIKAAASLSPVPKPLPRKRRSTSWLRRKQELHALRSESKALETQMVSLQMQRAHYAVQPPKSDTLTEAQEMWRSVAAIALQECQTAQAENMRLKSELQTYCLATETLQAQLSHANARQQTLIDCKVCFADAVRVGIIMSRRLNFDDNTAIFDILESKVGARCAELNKIAREAHLPVQGGATERVTVCREDGKDAAVEFHHVRLLPFGEDTTAKTLWEIVELGGLVTDRHFRVARRSGDMVAMASRFTVPSDSSSTVSVDVRAVAKRFATPMGMVILVESLSEWSVEHATAGDWKQSTEETGWVVVHEVSRRRDATPPACQLRTTMKLRPNAPSVGNCRSARSSFTGGVGDVVIPSFRDTMNSHHQSVENFLMDASHRTVAA